MSESKSLGEELPDLDVSTRTETAFDTPYEGHEYAFGGVPIPTPTSGETAPERVRFAVPAVLSFDGYEETFEVAILNLSANGVACTGPQGLAVRDRLRLNFRLNLTAQARSFLCEVIWVQSTRNDEATYGLRFVELDADLATHVLDTVRERVEGRASEWAMPIMPSSEDMGFNPDADVPSIAPPPPRGRRQMYIGAAAGMAAGIGLCLVGAAVSSYITDSNASADRQAAAARQPAAQQAAPKLDLKPVVQAPPVPTPAHVEALPAPAPAEPSPTATIPTTPVSSPKPDVRGAPPAESGRAESITSRPSGLQLEISPNGRGTLVLPLNGYAAQKDVFWLNNPTRLVVDVPGRQSTLDRGVYDLDSSLVGRVRIGQHPGKVRFVIETGKNVSSKVTAQAQGNQLRVEIQSQR